MKILVWIGRITPIEIYGLFVVFVAEPSNVINLENTTAYSVFCIITNALPDENISHLNIYEKNNRITSEVSEIKLRLLIKISSP